MRVGRATEMISRVLLLSVIALAVVLVLIFETVPARKPAQPPTARQIAQSECATRAYQAYLKDQLSLSKPKDVAKLLSVENAIAKRRLQERFCLEFTQCVVTDRTSQSYALQQGSAFDSCLRDEALEEYDAVLREDTDGSDAAQ
jgi:hypothetical protein